MLIYAAIAGSIIAFSLLGLAFAILTGKLDP
jgi:hypothetical protein